MKRIPDELARALGVRIEPVGPSLAPDPDPSYSELVDAIRRNTIALIAHTVALDRNSAATEASTEAIRRAWEINDEAEAWKRVGDDDA